LPTPQNLKGVTDSSLIDVDPVENFILCVLHIIVGMGNALVEAFLEWVEERVELLQQAEIEASNRVIFASIQFEKEKTCYETWLENDGILLSDFHLEKKQIKSMLGERKGILLL
jgi:hypothetical protein